MSHLIIEQGKEVGREITVPASGLKFGRSPANDLVLDGDAVMLFQGRFFFKSGGTLWVTDFSAAEKTLVGGEPIDEHALKVGDLVDVGATAFRVIGTKLGGESPAAPGVAKDSVDDEIDLGFKPANKSRYAKEKKERTKTQSLIHRVLQVAVILLFLLLVAVAIPELVQLNGKGVAPVLDQEKSLSFTYECVRGSWKNIFRYYLELTPEGVVSIQIDDLRNRHNSKSAEVSAEALEALSRRLGGSGFFEIERDYVVRAPNAYESYDIAIYRNGRFNKVRVLNREKPKDFEHTVSILEDFVFSELDVPFTLLEEDEVLIRYAGESFKLGEARFSERDVRPGNLAQSVKHYREALVYLEALDLKPDLYGRTKLGMARATSEQDARYKDYMFNAERAMRLGDWREAEKQLRILAELVPDRGDKRYETISSKQLEVEGHLR
ncbi:MAG: FHA domain-containing protein [Verrucomicrobiota bacterium]|nr:FHA domain-containing protein [Verrucomicrobiota bacterium]